MIVNLFESRFVYVKITLEVQVHAAGQYADNRPPQLEKLPRQYAEYTLWQRPSSGFLYQL